MMSPVLPWRIPFCAVGEADRRTGIAFDVKAPLPVKELFDSVSFTTPVELNTRAVVAPPTAMAESLASWTWTLASSEQLYRILSSLTFACGKLLKAEEFEESFSTTSGPETTKP